MGCEQWRASISAVVDGRPSPIDPRLVDAHVDGCIACRRHREAVIDARSIVAAAPDLSRRIAVAAARADRSSRGTLVRAALAVVAAEILVLSVPALVLGDEQDTSVHGARHLGAFTVAYAVGLLVVVVRPARARAMLPVAAVLAGALLITAVVDLVSGRVPVLGEARHVPELLSVGLIWLLAVPTTGGARWRHRGRTTQHVLPAMGNLRR